MYSIEQFIKERDKFNQAREQVRIDKENREYKEWREKHPSIWDLPIHELRRHKPGGYGRGYKRSDY